MDSPQQSGQQLPPEPAPIAPPQPIQSQVGGDPGGFDTASAQQVPTADQADQTQQDQSSQANTQDANQTQQQQSPQEQQNQQYTQYQDQNFIPGIEKPVPEQILLEWQAPSRAYKQRNRKYFSTVALISALIALILIFAGQLIAVAVIAAVFFVVYVLNSTPPGLITLKLTTYGIRVENELYYWEEMGRFWFTQKLGTDLLHIEIGRFPNRLTLLLGDIQKDDMQLILSEVLLHQQPPPTTYEKAATWLQEKLPIDIES